MISIEKWPIILQFEVTLGPVTATADSQACAESCQGNEACESWNYVRDAGSCQLQASVGLNRYTIGTDAGVRGRWMVDSDGRCVTLTRPGDAPTSGAVSLCAGDSSGSAASHSTLGTVLSTFGASGSLSGGSGGGGLQGAAVIGAAVPSGGSNRSIRSVSNSRILISH